MMTDSTFWDNQEKAQDVIDKNNALKSVVNAYRTLESELEDMDTTRALLLEEDDETMKQDLEQSVQDFKNELISSSYNYYLMGLMTRIMPSWNYIQVQAVQSHRIGRICS